MDNIIISLIVGIVALIVGIGVTIMVQKKLATSKAKTIIDEATSEAENIKKTKILEAREEESRSKNETTRVAAKPTTKRKSTSTQ